MPDTILDGRGAEAGGTGSSLRTQTQIRNAHCEEPAYFARAQVPGSARVWCKNDTIKTLLRQIARSLWTTMRLRISARSGTVAEGWGRVVYPE